METLLDFIDAALCATLNRIHIFFTLFNPLLQVVHLGTVLRELIETKLKLFRLPIDLVLRALDRAQTRKSVLYPIELTHTHKF